MEYLKLNSYSYLTAKKRKSLSPQAKYLLNKRLLIGEVLDFGCGFGKDVELIKANEINITGYDIHYFPVYPNQKFDTIISLNVLDVLMPEEQESVLMQVSHLLKPEGKAYFAVKRDIHYEGFKIHKVHKKPIYQSNVILGYSSIFKNDDFEIYEYKHYNQLKRKENLSCPFCNPGEDRELIVESSLAYSMYDAFPVSRGHSLIIPKKHCSNYFDLTFSEQSACMFMLNTVNQIVTKKFKPDGFNIGINIKEAAGQTVPHVHIHIIPRYNGDVKEPRGGVRGVIPEKKNY